MGSFKEFPEVDITSWGFSPFLSGGGAGYLLENHAKTHSIAHRTGVLLNQLGHYHRWFREQGTKGTRDQGDEGPRQQKNRPPPRAGEDGLFGCLTCLFARSLFPRSLVPCDLVLVVAAVQRRRTVARVAGIVARLRARVVRIALAIG